MFDFLKKDKPASPAPVTATEEAQKTATPSWTERLK